MNQGVFREVTPMFYTSTLLVLYLLPITLSSTNYPQVAYQLLSLSPIEKFSLLFWNFRIGASSQPWSVAVVFKPFKKLNTCHCHQTYPPRRGLLPYRFNTPREALLNLDSPRQPSPQSTQQTGIINCSR